MIPIVVMVTLWGSSTLAERIFAANGVIHMEKMGETYRSQPKIK